MDVRAQINLPQLARRMSSGAGRSYDAESAAAFLRGAGCRPDGDDWLVPLSVLQTLRPDEVRVLNKQDSRAS